MSLSPEELDMLSEIVSTDDEIYTSEQIETKVSTISSATETILKTDIETWNDVRDDHLKIKGGRSGVDMDEERQRDAIRRRCRRRLGISGGGIQLYAGGVTDETSDPFFYRNLHRN